MGLVANEALFCAFLISGLLHLILGQAVVKDHVHSGYVQAVVKDHVHSGYVQAASGNIRRDDHLKHSSKTWRKKTKQYTKTKH